ncbi:MAG TPA: hypothetical protein VIY47_03425, partial [Ignavibacteriaceae bacterium]
MKNIYNKGLLILIISVATLFQGCEILENYFLNLPLKQPITSTGSNTTISEVENICLQDYDAYQDNIDEIQSITYVAALYRTLDSPQLTPGLAGQNINVTVVDGDGILIFSRDLPTAVATDYIDTPYEIELNTGEITIL